MKVKIKQGNEMINATIEMVDGVMVVSPKEEKFGPKDGDVVFSGSSLISIFKEMSSGTSLAAYTALSNGELKKEFDFWSASNIRPATEEEKQKLFDKIKEEGYEWDAKKKELVKIKWKLKKGEPYFSPIFSNVDFLFSTCRHIYTGHFTDELTFKKTSVFKTEQECQEFCNRLNDAINSVKP